MLNNSNKNKKSNYVHAYDYVCPQLIKLSLAIKLWHRKKLVLQLSKLQSKDRKFMIHDFSDHNGVHFFKKKAMFMCFTFDFLPYL